MDALKQITRSRMGSAASDTAKGALLEEKVKAQEDKNYKNLINDLLDMEERLGREVDPRQ